MDISLHLYLAFIAASLIILVIPGPTIVLVIGQALAQGRRIAFASVAGVALGDLIATGLSMAGAGAILATSATLFQILKFAGAAYLVWLGLKMWRTPITLPDITIQTTIAQLYAASIQEHGLLQKLIRNRQQQLNGIAQNLIKHATIAG